MCKKKKEIVDEDKFVLDKDSMKIGKPDQKPPISIGKFLKRKLIFILIYTILIAAVLIYFVIMTNKKNADNSNENVVIDNNTITNETNKAKKVSYEYTNKNNWFYLNPIGYDYKTTKDGKNSIRYIEIDGLANDKMQSKVNKYLQDQEKSYLEEMKKKYPRAVSFKVLEETVGNFGNIFSAIINIYVEINEEQTVYGFKYITVNLIDGEKVEIEDLIDNNEINSILQKYGYNELSKDFTVRISEDGIDEKFDKNNAGNLEEESYQFVYDVINHSSKVSMGVSSSAILIGYPQKTSDEIYTRIISIPLNEINKKEFVYNRYLGQNIYNNKYEKIGPFPVYMESVGVDKVIYEKGDNYFVYFVIEDNSDLNSVNTDEAMARVTDYMKKLSDTTLSKADNDKSRFYYFTAQVKMWKENNLEGIGTNIYGVKNYYLTKELFDSVVYSTFINNSYNLNEENFREALISSPDVGSPEEFIRYLLIDPSGNIIKENSN